MLRARAVSVAISSQFATCSPSRCCRIGVAIGGVVAFSSPPPRRHTSWEPPSAPRRRPRRHARRPATRNSFVSEQREEHWLQCSPSRHTALSSRHAGPAWLKTAYEATRLNATTDAPPRRRGATRRSPSSSPTAKRRPRRRPSSRRRACCSSRRSEPLPPPPPASRTRCPRRRWTAPSCCSPRCRRLHVPRHALRRRNWALTVLLLALAARGAVVMPPGLRGWLWSAVGIAAPSPARSSSTPATRRASAR